jgi:hypothetical protein
MNISHRRWSSKILILKMNYGRKISFNLQIEEKQLNQILVRSLKSDFLEISISKIKLLKRFKMH